MKTNGERRTPLSVPPGGSGKLYGIVVVPESCPRGKFPYAVPVIPEDTGNFSKRNSERLGLGRLLTESGARVNETSEFFLFLFNDKFFGGKNLISPGIP